MTANGFERLNMWLEAGRPADYAVFKAACDSAGIEPLPALEFAQKLGMILCALEMYRELPVAEAYLKFVKENQVAFTPTTQQPVAATQASSGCTGCGGGSVL